MYPLKLATAPTLLLDRRALYRSKGTEYAAVTGIGAKQGRAIDALIIELASVYWHSLLSGKAAMRTSHHRFQNNCAHGNVTSAPKKDINLHLSAGPHVKNVGTFVGILLQKGAKLWVVPTISSESSASVTY